MVDCFSVVVIGLRVGSGCEIPFLQSSPIASASASISKHVHADAACILATSLGSVFCHLECGAGGGEADGAKGDNDLRENEVREEVVAR